MDADRFWRLSLIEWRAISQGLAMRSGGSRSAQPLERVQLADLLTRYPD